MPRQRVYAAFANRGVDVEDATRRALAVGSEYLDLDIGFFTQITDEVQTVAVAVGEHDTVRPGESCPLDQAYCQRTIETQGPLSVHNAIESAEITDDAYETFGLDTYIGAKVLVDGEVYGTVCFSSTTRRTEPFSEDEELFVELIAQLIGQALERRTYREEIERENRRYQTLVDANFDVIYQVAPDGTFEFISPAIEETVGYAPAELRDEHFETIVRDTNLSTANRVHERVLDGDAVQGVELEVVTADGAIAILEINAMPMVDDGDVQLVQGVARDITERKQRERRLRRFENAVEHAGHGVMITDADGTIEYVNPTFEEMTGYARNDVLGRTPAVLGSDEHDASFYERLWTTIRGGDVWKGEVVNERVDGSQHIIDQTIAPITNAGGEIDGFVAINQDITARLNREAELQLKNRAIDEARVGITIFDVEDDETRLAYANDYFAQQSGYTSGELFGEGLEVLVGEETDTEILETVARSIETGDPATAEWIAYRKNGAPFWNATTITPVTEGNGTVSHYVGFHRDVTNRKRTERLLDVLNRVLRHNIRNDLTVILGYARELETQLESDPSITDEIVATGSQLLEVSERARELEQFIGREYAPTRHDPEQLCSRVVTDYREAFPDATIDINVETNRQLVAGPDIERVLSELLENALVHDDDPPTTVRVTVQNDGDNIRLTVDDDGSGIHPDEASIIEQGRETVLDHNLGLGLWITNWIVTKYGGSFQIRPKPAADRPGTVADVRLPSLPENDSLEEADTRPTTLFR